MSSKPAVIAVSVRVYQYCMLHLPATQIDDIDDEMHQHFSSI